MAEGAERIVEGTIGAVGAVTTALTSWNSILTSLTGFVPHAMLFVPKIQSNVAGRMAENLAPKALNEDILALRALVKTRNKKTKGVGGTEGLVAKQVKSTTSFIGLATELEARGFVAMEVQYNPNSIKLTNSAGVIRNSVAAGDGAIAQHNTIGDGIYTNFIVQLIFDDVNLQDAFLTEGVSLTATGGVELAKNLVTNIAKEEGFSVQKQTEGLLSLLLFNKTKNVIFYWSDMFFHGWITSVNARYTMFNKLGHPVRSVVDLRLQQASKQSTFKTDEKAWEEAITACFGEPGVGNLTSF